MEVIPLLSINSAAYYLSYTHGSAYKVIGIKNDLSSNYSSDFSSSVIAWNDGLNKRSINIISSGATNSIIDLDYTKVLDISYDLTFLFQTRNQELGTYKSWNYNATTCCSNHQTTSFIIYINTNMLPSNATSSKKQWVISHELGHALGLDHFTNSTNYKNHVMNYSCTYSTYYTPNSDEINGANIIWNH